MSKVIFFNDFTNLIISDTSPVMDMLNHHSGRSSPAQVNSESKSLDKANEEFKEVLEKLQKSSLEKAPNGETDIENNEVEVKTKSVKKTLVNMINRVKQPSKVKKVPNEIPLNLLPGQKIFH